MKDTFSRLALVQVVAPVLVKDATVPEAVIVDLVDFNSALVEFSCNDKASGDTGTITLKMEHADESAEGGTPGTFSDVTSDDVLGVTPSGGVIFTLAGGAVAKNIYKCGYVGGKRYLRFTLAETGVNATGTILSVTVIKGHGLNVPAV